MESLPVLLIGGCHKYFDYLKAAIQRAKKEEVWRVIGVVGSAETTYFDEKTQILHLSVSDVYEALPAKLHAAYCWIVENFPGIPGIFKTDDDIVWNPISTLAGAVTKRSLQVIPYWGVKRDRCREAPVNQRRIAYRFSDTSLRPTHPAAEYCYGCGYWLSAEILPVICSSVKEFSNATLEDVCTGAVLNAAGIKPLQVNLPFSEVPRIPEILNLLI